jgi:RNA polymerase sigma factor (sigma-70 family)
MPLTDDEWRDLLAQIEPIAASVGHRCNASPTVRDELADSAATHVFEHIEQYDPMKSAFRTWCRTVLRNHCVSLIRREATRVKGAKRHADRVRQAHEQRLLDEPPPTPLESAEDEAAQARRRPIDIAASLERYLQPVDRILLAVYAELSAACGPATLARWCEEAGGVDPAALGPIEALGKSKRKQALAGLLGEKVDWVRQRIFRAIRRLRDRGIGSAQG